MSDLQTREQMLAGIVKSADILDLLGKVDHVQYKTGWQSKHLAADAIREITRLRTALSEAEQRAKDAEGNLNEEISHRQKLQAALMFWMPSVTEEIEKSTNGRCGDDSGLLAGYDGPIDASCWGDEIHSRAQRARREALEEAAILAGSIGDEQIRSGSLDLEASVDKIIVAIRALIPSEPHDAEGRE